MPPYHRLITALIVPAMLGGCFLPNAAKKPTGLGTGALREGVVRGKLPGAAGKPAVAAPTAATAGGNLVSNNGAGVISNNAGSLSGVVRAPASLISNNGGGIISNNSGGYRVRSFRLLSTVSEVAVAKARVTLLDAEGKQLVGSDGKPIVTETDDQGRYSFKGILPANNLLVAVVLAGDKGTLRAIAPKGGGDTRKADLNLISTLTTGYILNQYVNTQANRQSTLDKLPPNVESETRAKAATAFNESGASVPTALTDASVVQTVTAMRQKSPAFDAQMEDVKKLLIAAGQSDLGSGRPALEVSFDWVNHLLLDANGKLLIACNYDRRLWRIDANGNLVTAAGKGGTASLASPNGVNGPDASLARFASVTSDAQGRPLILESSLNYEDSTFPDAGRLTRLGADGKLTELAARIPGASYAVPGAGDEVLVLASHYGNDEDEIATYELWSVSPGGAPVKKHTFSATDSEMLDTCEEVSGDGQGRLFITPGFYDEATDTDTSALYRLDAGATALTKVTDLPSEVSTVFDSRGNIFMWNYDADAISVRKADGTTASVLSPVPSTFGGGSLDAAVLAPDGTAYVSWGAKVYKVVAGTATAIAGTGESQATGGATTVAVAPSGMAVAASGEIYFSGLNDSAIYRIGADKQVKLFAGFAAVGDGEEEEEDPAPRLKVGPALQVDLTFPDTVQTDAAGNVYFSDIDGDWIDGEHVSAARVCKVDAAGQLTNAFRLSEPGGDVRIESLSVAPDGTLYMAVVSETEYQGDDEAEEDAFEPTRTVRLMRQAPGAAPTTLKTDNDAELILSYSLAATAEGMYVASTTSEDGPGTLSRWTPAGGFQALKSDARFEAWDISMQVDKAGRLYIAKSSDNVIYRYDVAAGTFKTIAGKGGTHFAGTSVDTSVDEPGFPCFDKDGNLFFADTGHRQIKRIPANEL